MPIIIGLDIGTSGARAMAVREDGTVIHTATAPLPQPSTPEPGWSEQHPADWWSAASIVLKQVAASLPAGESVAGMAVDSTSGTIVPVDAKGTPLTPALLYNDGRAAAESSELNTLGAELCATMGYRFNASYALAKILWIRRHQPDIYEKTHKFLHAADVIVGQLTGDYTVTDTSNVLKTGYDLVHNRWPAFLGEAGIDEYKLPRVVRSGEVIGTIRGEIADGLGLPRGIRVVAGASDGTAGFLSSGAVLPGDYNTTLGTTLVVKGVSTRIVIDPLGRIYSHAHPAGHWLPGGASNVGGECLQRRFAGANLAALDARVKDFVPTSVIVYPLVRKGERFPFVNPNAEGFMKGTPNDEAESFAAHLEGVAFVERWIYELLSDLGGGVGDSIYCTGGGSKSPVWMQLRADIMGRTLVRPMESEAAYGMAILAAAGTVYDGDLAGATRHMVKLGIHVAPEERMKPLWDEKYTQFRNACLERGYK